MAMRPPEPPLELDVAAPPSAERAPDPDSREATTSSDPPAPPPLADPEPEVKARPLCPSTDTVPFSSIALDSVALHTSITDPPPDPPS